MGASALLSVLILGFLLALKCEFSSALAQEQAVSSSHSTVILYQIIGDLYELQGENIKMAKKIEMLEENLESPRDTSAENKKMAEMAEKIEMLEGKLESLVQESTPERAAKVSGSVYVRWGRTACPNSTQFIYKGITSGGHFWEPGDGTNMLCLPENPTWGKYKDGHDRQRAHIYGVEIDIEANPIFEHNMNEQDQPCVVCHTSYAVTHMFPGRTSCFPGWSLQYAGYLMSSEHKANVNREYFCMDSDPQPMPRGGTNDNQGIVYLVEGRCGSLPCPPYHEGREIACAVCSK